MSALLRSTLARLSVIVPVLNEESAIQRTLDSLQAWRDDGAEIIVVDGGSRDQTLTLARPLADRVLVAGPGRAQQMNRGACAARAPTLLFLHADSILPTMGLRSILTVLDQGARWGWHDIRLSGPHWPFRMIERMMNLRSRLTRVATGDQAIFVEAALFRHCGGFPDIELMEDIALSQRLRGHARPVCMPGPCLTSSRRWERHGIWRTVLLMWQLRLRFFFGAQPRDLARMYREAR